MKFHRRSRGTINLLSIKDAKQIIFNESLIWLRMNAGGVLNTCKSSEALKSDSSDEDFL